MAISDLLTKHANILRTKTGVTSKLTFSDMTRLLDDLSWDKENLLEGTSSNYRTLTGSHQKYFSMSTAKSPYVELTNKSEWYTYALIASNPTTKPFRLEIWQFAGSNPLPYIYAVHSAEIKPGEKDKLLQVGIKVNSSTTMLRAYVITSNSFATTTDSLEVKCERLYAGTEPGIWVPNPADKVGGVTNPLLYALFMVRGCVA